MAIGASVPIAAAGADLVRLQGPGASGEASAHPGASAFTRTAARTCHTMADAGIERHGRAEPRQRPAGLRHGARRHHERRRRHAGVRRRRSTRTRSTAWRATSRRGPAARRDAGPERRRGTRSIRRRATPPARTTPAAAGGRAGANAGGGARRASIATTDHVRVFLGITGASGAPYAARVLDGLAAAGAEVGVCASAAAGEVIAWELYRDRSLDPAEAVERLVAEHGGDRRDAVRASATGSRRTPRARRAATRYVICPCSMATCGTIATSGQANLIHRAAGVALKEDRRLVLVPRETPLSAIHLEALLTLRRAGALIMPAMPAFYTHPDTLDDVIDFVAGRVLDLLGVEHDLLRRWRELSVHDLAGAPGRCRPSACERMFDRIAGPYDADEPRHDRRPRPPLARAAPPRPPASAAGATRARRLLRHRRPHAASWRGASGRSGEVIGVDFSPRMLERARAQARRAPDSARVRCVRGRRAGAAARRTTASPPRPSPSACATCADLDAASASSRASCAPAGASSASRSRSRSAAPLAGFYRVWFDRLVPAVGRVVDRRGDSAYSYLPASVRRFPPRRRARPRACYARRPDATSATRCWPAASSPSTSGEVPR